MNVDTPLIDAITYYVSCSKTSNLSKIPATYSVTLLSVIAVWAMTDASPACLDSSPACSYGVARGSKKAAKEERYWHALSFY